MIKVANIRDAHIKIAVKNHDPGVLYCGRKNPYYSLPASKWANPFEITAKEPRDVVIAKYRAYITSRPDLMAALPELKDKTLVCWCHPKPCHCDVLKELAEKALGNP